MEAYTDAVEEAIGQDLLPDPCTPEQLLDALIEGQRLIIMLEESLTEIVKLLPPGHRDAVNDILTDHSLKTIEEMAMGLPLA